MERARPVAGRDDLPGFITNCTQHNMYLDSVEKHMPASSQPFSHLPLLTATTTTTPTNNPTPPPLKKPRRRQQQDKRVLSAILQSNRSNSSLLSIFPEQPLYALPTTLDTATRLTRRSFTAALDAAPPSSNSFPEQLSTSQQRRL
jgi:hypothetical protein